MNSFHWQMYWPDWWKLWPRLTRFMDIETNVAGHVLVVKVFTFSAYQCRWYELIRMQK